jgi:hypothetical protein
MRANEFVANKIYQESKLFEDELSDFFQIEEIRVEGEKKFRLKYGPDDTEGELFDTRREAQQAKREQIKLARQVGRKKLAGDNPDFLKKVYKGFPGWFNLLLLISAIVDISQYKGRVKDLYTYLRHGSSLCTDGNIGSVMAKDYCAKRYAKNASFQLATIAVGVLEAATIGVVAAVTITRLIKNIPIGGAQLLTVAIWLGAEALNAALQILISEKWQAKWVAPLDDWLYFNHILKRVLHQNNIRDLCIDRGDLSRPSLNDIRVPQTGCSTVQNEAIESTASDTSKPVTTADMNVIFDSIWSQDPTLKKLLAKAEERKASGSAPALDLSGTIA